MSDWCAEPPPSLLLKGIEQFNRGEFFAQHETLEELWRAETRDVRYLYQGILQIGVGLHHIKRLNPHGAVYMLSRGITYLRQFAPHCQGVDVVELLEQADRALTKVVELGPERLQQFDWSLAPKVALIETTG